MNSVLWKARKLPSRNNLSKSRLDGGELRRLAEWWRVGGKHLHQQHEAERIKRLNAPLTTRSVESPPYSPLPDYSPSPGWEFIDLFDLLRIAVNLFMHWR